MRLLPDTNVLVDFLAQRPPFLKESSELIDLVLRGRYAGVIAFHSVTTIYYLIERADGPQSAIESVDWLVSRFTIASAGQALLLRARKLALPDFEDAVIVASAEQETCDAIITRDKHDFTLSPVPVFDPKTFLSLYGRHTP